MINVDNLLSNILLDLSAKVGKVDLANNNHINELYNVLLENGFNSVLANDYIREVKAVISERKVSRNQIKNKISSVFGLEQTGSENSNTIIEVPNDFDVDQFVGKLNSNGELKSEIGYQSAEIIAGRTYPSVVFKFSNAELAFKLSSRKSRASGKQPMAEEYEDGIAVAYNMKLGLSKEDAIKKANANSIRMNSTIGDIVLGVGNKVAAKLVGPEYLSSMGSSDYSVSDKWPPSNGTPKTDLMGGNNYRISVKKSGGSQLMSGKGSGDSIGVFRSALEYYSKYERSDYNAHIVEFIDKMKSQFGEVKIDKNMDKIKGDVYDEWLTKRITKVTEEYDVISPNTIGTKKHREQIEKHIKAELIDAGYADMVSSYRAWFISGVDNKSNEVSGWFKNIYLANKGNVKELETVFNLSMVHRQLQNELTLIFEDKAFKKWVVFEAASGQYKFTGGIEPTTIEPVANKLLVFDDDGMKQLVEIDAEWAELFANHVSHQIGFKSSGVSKFSTIRLLTSESKLPKTELLVDQLLTDAVSEELIILQNSYENELKSNILEEGFKINVSKLFNWLTNGLQKFWKDVIIKFFNKIIEYAKQGISYLAEAFGIEIIGSSIVDVTF
jgi:hypothetical protein